VRLVWVFRSFQTENRPAAIDDIYFGNNRNAFVVSSYTGAASKEAGRMMMFCHWPHGAASLAIFDYLECFYNRRRLHTSLGNTPPLSFLNRFFQNLNPSLN